MKNKEVFTVNETMIRQLAEQYGEDIVALRRQLHRCPELGREEHQTAAFIRAELDKLGIPWRAVGATGTLATLEATKEGGSTVVLRSDIDALPVEEETGLDFASQIPDMMHACGHDCHIAMLLGAAKILVAVPERVNTVRFLFQPAEECGAGALDMIEGGVLDGADTVYGAHIWPDVPRGKIAIPDGPVMAGGDSFVIRVTGLGGHGSQPERCKNPIPVVTAITDQIHQIKALCVRGDEPLAVTVGYIQCGTAKNVIPDSGELGGTIRWFSRETRELVMHKICTIAENCAALYGVEAEVTFSPISGSVNNHADCARQAREALSALYGEEKVISHIPVSMSSEDFAFYGEHVPTVFAWIGCLKDGAAYGLHNPHFDPDESVLPAGSALHACYGLNFRKA